MRRDSIEGRVRERKRDREKGRRRGKRETSQNASGSVTCILRVAATTAPLRILINPKSVHDERANTITADFAVAGYMWR